MTLVNVFRLYDVSVDRIRDINCFFFHNTRWRRIKSLRLQLGVFSGLRDAEYIPLCTT